MNLLLQKSQILNLKSQIEISGSKSETNRLLLLQALYPNIALKNKSNSDDSEVMTKALQNQNPIQDVHHAGTAMRFLTAYYSIREGEEVVLTGSSRMKERPISILVNALRQLGAKIEYTENEGFPPLKIVGKKIVNNKVSLSANVSSQYISALLLVATKLENGLELTLEGEITSIPYIKMTLGLLNDLGIQTSFEKNKIKVTHANLVKTKTVTIESDWSSASYWYSIVAFSEIGTKVTLSSYKQNSLQGDSVLVEIYKNFGVETIFNGDQSITISKTKRNNQKVLTANLQSSPDIAQTIAVTCFGIGMGCCLTGLHTLKIKETDRLEALQNELTKLGADVVTTTNSITLEPASKINSAIAIKTYQDHRMAMAFAPLALKTNLVINDAEVVTKSYPNFWNDLRVVGLQIQEL